jgi:hypothetical protein
MGRRSTRRWPVFGTFGKDLGSDFAPLTSRVGGAPFQLTRGSSPPPPLVLKRSLGDLWDSGARGQNYRKGDSHCSRLMVLGARDPAQR